ncbi:MAG: EAL domain-containing protein [Chromatiales bacterium]|jgi:diguanylate cyclase (GGDEF)-like protein/PAS domain S-box-containing protein
MSNTPDNHMLKHWVLLAIVMTGLLLLGYRIYDEQYQDNKKRIYEHTEQELALLGVLSEKALRAGEYEAIQLIFNEWSETQQDTLALTLQTASGYFIGEFHRISDSEFTHSLNKHIEYGYNNDATLTLVKDVSAIYTQRLRTGALAATAWLVAGLFGIYLIRNMHIRNIETNRLAQLSQELTATNENLKREQILLRSLINSIPDLIFFKNEQGVFLGCNKAFEEFVGCPEPEQVGRTDLDFFDEKTAKAFRANDRRMLKSGKPRRNEEWVTYPDGHQVLLDTLKTPYYDPDGNVLGLIGISRDITEIKNYQAQLEELAYNDILTHLPNRRYLVDRMQQAIASADRHNTKFAVCALDLDGFKPINDQLGHAAGDKFLIEFSKRLTHSLRTEDTVARWGGDEFTLLFTDIRNNNECVELVERLQNLISTPYTTEGKEFILTASIGLTIYPDDKGDADTLLRHADQAMYNAKSSGKNQYHFFDAEQDKLMHSQHENLARIEQAIQQDELELHFHPQIHLKQSKVYGVETLVRWQHPEKGLLPPAEFLPFIEDHIMCVDLDWWVLHAAVRQLSDWVRAGYRLRLGINVSAITFQQPDFVQRLQQLFSGPYKKCAKMVSLEILETAALGNLEVISEKMEQCQKLGLQFALDDFGTGYSSLTYLSRLPAETLKIDRLFVRDMLVDERDANIVEGIVRLAAAFNRSVIAEGVEDVQHGLRLIEIGCEYAQGYAIARPMPAEELLDWIRNYEAPKEWLQAS